MKNTIRTCGALLLVLAMGALASGCVSQQQARAYYANYYTEQMDRFPNTLVTYDTGVRMWKLDNELFNLRIFLEEGKDYAFNIKLTNISDAALVIDWNRVMYIDVKGYTHHVIHNGVNYWDPVASQTPSVVNAGTTLNDLIQPAKLVQQDGAVRLAPLTSDDTATWGEWPQDATLLLPMQTAEGEKVYRVQLDMSSGGPWW